MPHALVASSSAAPTTPGSRAVSGDIALKRCVKPRTPASSAARISAYVAAVWPAQTIAPRRVSSPMTSAGTHSGASVITLYLLRSLNTRLIPQLQKLKPGSRIVSHDFDIDGVKPEVSLQMEAPNGSGTGSRMHRVYKWTAPLIVSPPKPAPTP